MTYDERDAHPHPFVQNLTGVYYYEQRDVNRGRKPKICIACDGTINPGEPARHFKFCGHDGDWPDNIVCFECLEDPEVKGLIKDMENHKFDDDDV